MFCTNKNNFETLMSYFTPQNTPKVPYAALKKIADSAPPTPHTQDVIEIPLNPQLTKY